MRSAPAKPVVKPAPAKKPSGSAAKKWAKRLGILVVILAGGGLAAFTWFAYWPFEGKFGRVDSLVPADVDFVVRMNWTETKGTGWLQRNLWDDPVLPSLDPRTLVVDEQGTTLAVALEQIPETEDQINESIPGALKTLEGIVFGTKEFRVEKDLFPAEVVAAGRWCGGGSPSEGPPHWREILLLTRVSPLVKFAFEAVRHDFVRKQALARDDIEIEATPEGILRIELRRMRVPRKRATCEGGLEMGPMNVWWVTRVKDVLAVSNSEDLIRRTRDVAKGSEDRAMDRPGFEVEQPEGGIAATLDLVGLRSYMNRFFSSGDESQRVGSFLGKFLAVESLDRMGATIAPSLDGISVRADVAYSAERLREFRDVLATYDLPPTPVAEGLARLLPQKDTAIAVQVTTPPRALLHALYDNIKKEDQRVIRERIRMISADRRAAGKQGYDDVGEFLDDLAAQLGTNNAIAIARISAAFNDQMFSTWYSNEDPVPTSTLAAMLRIKEGARQEEVNEFLSDRVRALGFLPPVPVTSPEGITYSRLVMDGKKPRDYALVEPAFKVHDGYLILCTREDYLLEILKVMRGGAGAPKSFGSSDGFRGVMGSLPPDATLGAFIDAGNLRALLWDYRNEWVHMNHPDNLYANAFRARRHAEISKGGGRVDLKTVNEEVDKEIERYRLEEYPGFLREYRAKLDASSRVAASGLVLAARKADTKIEVGLRVLFAPSVKPPE